MKKSQWVAVVLSMLAGCSGSDRPGAVGNDLDSGSTTADSSVIDSTTVVDSGSIDDGSSDGTTPDSTGSDGSSADATDAVSLDGGSSDVSAETTPPLDGGLPLSDASLADSFGDDSEPGDVKPDPGPSCLPTAAATTSVAALNSGNDELFAAITPDERTLVFYRVSSSGTVTVFTSDRATAKAAFGAPLTVTTPPTGIAPKRMAISPDGLRLVVVSADGRSLRQIVRASRSVGFTGAADATPFANVNKLASDGPSLLGYPVLTGDDLGLYFTYGDPTVAPAIRRSSRATSGDAWGAIAPVEGPAVTSTGTMGMVPTGISNDGRTLFVWTPTGNHEWAVYRDSPVALFTGRTDLGTKQFATTSGDCLTLYYCSPNGGSGLDLFFDD